MIMPFVDEGFVKKKKKHMLNQCCGSVNSYKVSFFCNFIKTFIFSNQVILFLEYIARKLFTNSKQKLMYDYFITVSLH